MGSMTSSRLHLAGRTLRGPGRSRPSRRARHRRGTSSRALRLGAAAHRRPTIHARGPIDAPGPVRDIAAGADHSGIRAESTTRACASRPLPSAAASGEHEPPARQGITSSDGKHGLGAGDGRGCDGRGCDGRGCEPGCSWHWPPCARNRPMTSSHLRLALSMGSHRPAPLPDAPRYRAIANPRYRG
jgi:hypothetical protein